MPSLHITTFGSAWTGGYSINSITQGDDGWVYLAGGKANGVNNIDPVVVAYQHGVLMWEKTFGGPKTAEEFRSVFARDSYVYAAGGIREGFDPVTHDNQQFPERPANSSEPDLNCAPFLVKLGGNDGNLEFARVLETNYVGNSVASGIAVDSLGNIFVNGGLEVAPNGENFTGLKKFTPQGMLDWEIIPGETLNSNSGIIGGTGGNIRLDDSGNVYTFSGYQLAKLTDSKILLGTYWPVMPDNPFSSNNSEDGTYLKDFIVDLNGDAYFVGVETSSLTAGTTVVAKVKNLHNHYSAPDEPDFLWTKRFEGTNNTPSSICFDADGKLLIAGSTSAPLNGNATKGLFDGFLATLDPDSGEILQTTIIGTAKNEWLTQAIVNAGGDVLISGEFSSKFYSIENTTFENIYLISKDGFTLMGNELDNEIQSGEGADTISAGDGDDQIGAGAGNDTVYAGLGDDLIIGGDGKGNDKYYGGEGSDTVKYTSATWGITVDLTRGTAASLSNPALRGNRDAANIGADRLYEIENVTAGNYNDVLSGNQLANEIRGEDGDDRIDGKSGNDVLHGGAGNDSLTGGAGNDVMAGGTGDDVYDVDSLADAVTELSGEGTDTVRTQLSSYTLGNHVENLTYTGRSNSTLTGNSLNNQIVGGGRADTLDGGAGNDLLLGALGNDTLVAGWDELALRGGDDTLRGGAGNDTYEIHKSTALYDDIIIDELADRGAGTDTLKIYEDLTLGPDIDTVTRGAILNDDGSITTLFYVDGTATGSYTVRGQIEYIVNSGKDQFGEWTPLKIQTWYAGKSWKLDQSAAMTLGYGTARNDNLVGSSKDDVISGFSGNDALTGGLGNDTLDGGGGSDTASYAERALAVIANLAEGTATIGAETDMLISIENLIGGRGNDELTGDDGTNILNGGGGNDTLDGGDSNDTLIGGAGNDRYRIHEVVGGNDTIQDSGGSDGLDWIDYGQDYVMDMARVGTQSRDLAVTFRDISTGDLLQTTTIKAQFSTSSKLGASAIEMFYGMEYDDGNLVYGGPTLKFVGGLVGDADHNIIVGLAKADIINGGGGMDVIFAGAGNDTVYGGTEDDVISGASGYDRLFGDAGNDQLRGDAGNDELTGGSGSDEFWFRFALDSSTNLDTITDFESGADKICLSSQLFHELNGQIDENNFLVNQTGQAEDADDRLIFDTDTRTLYYDADGFGGEASIAFVTLTGVQSLSVGDIMLIG